MNWLADILLGIYMICAVGLMIYGINCYVMVALFLKEHRSNRAYWNGLIEDKPLDFTDLASLPYVTTQLPLYNEANVSERIIRAAVAIDYPKEKHEIQVLDDSTDETAVLVDNVVSVLKNEGFDIKVLRREKRVGYKGGALREGMKQCKGSLIAIFDSDFMPPVDYLRKMLSVLMSDEKLGFVQARWGHINSEHSLLTRAQKLGIDGHFMIEQCARAYNQLFLNFNGTAGLWRKTAIEEAGNWQDDTLTEDMDLSYRCQLAGWKATYLPDVVVPAELPDTYAAFKNQQFRWAKGSIQTAVKLMPRVLKSDAGLLKKVQAFLHLTHYCIHPMMAAMALLALPALLVVDVQSPLLLLLIMAAGIMAAMLGPSSMYWVSQAVQGREHLKHLFFLPALTCIGVGIALSNSRAVFEGLFGIKTAFIRTPKRGMGKKSYQAVIGVLPFVEILLGVYCFYTMLVYNQSGKYLVGPFLLIYALGFTYVGIRSLHERMGRT